MVLPDLIAILNWWATWFFLGVVSLPVVIIWLKPLWDNGYGFAKLVGLVVVGFVVWYASSLKLIPFSNTALWITLALWTLGNAYLLWKQLPSFKALFKNQWPNWLKQEIIFLCALIFWSIIRGYQPDINGLEKFMDYGFVNAISRSSSMPPSDMWFAGGYINYYYFGHYLSAVIIKFSEIPTQIGYNLQLATLFALSVSGGISLGTSVINTYRDWTEKRISYTWIATGGLLTAFLLAIRGNLHWGAYQLNRLFNGCFSLFISDPQTIPACTASFSWLPDATKDYWYPDATRYIPYTIHEFPMYSFVVADLHAHLINLPLVLVFLGAVFALLQRLRITWYETFGLGALLGIFYMSNAWDLPIYLLVLTATLAIIALKQYPLSSKVIYMLTTAGGLLGVLALVTVVATHSLSNHSLATSGLSNYRIALVLILAFGLGVWYVGNSILQSVSDRTNLWNIIKLYISKLAVAMVMAVVASLPFHLAFEQIAEGVQPVEAFSEHSKLLTLWGWDIFIMLSFALALISMIQLHSRKDQDHLPAITRVNRYDLWVMALYVIGFALIVIPEFIYVKDIYIKEYHRANTMFKLVYQSWVIFSVANSYAIIRVITLPVNILNGRYLAGFIGIIGLLILSVVIENNFLVPFAIGFNFLSVLILGLTFFPIRLPFAVPTLNLPLAVSKIYKYVWISLVVLMLWAMGNYPVQAINSYYGKLKPETYKGLDGESWFARNAPDEYAALLWLRNLPNQPTILEAVGDSYTEFNRFSAYSGFPTVEGWLVHEWLWRGSYDQPGRRASEVEHLYTATAVDQTKPAYQAPDIPSPQQLIQNYNIDYIIVGDKEREKYGETLNESLIASMGEKVFESGETRIYQVNK